MDVWKVNGSYWRFFKPHHYLKLGLPPAAEFFVGTVKDELVTHVAVAPLFNAGAYRGARLVVMPEWQGVGVGTTFLNHIAQYHLEGNGRCNKPLPMFFHTSHPQLCAYLRRAKGWHQTGARLFGTNKAKSAASISRAPSCMTGAGYGGHFRAIQAFKYTGIEKVPT